MTDMQILTMAINEVAAVIRSTNLMLVFLIIVLIFKKMA